MKKVFFFLFVFLFFKIDFSRGLEATNLYYYDDNKNQKVDRIRLEFDSQITGTLDFSKLQLYSNTWWLASFKINSETGYFSWYTLSWNLLDLSLIEQDNSKLDLIINDTTTSDLRLKSLLWIGITDLSGVEMTKLSLTTSFNSYNPANIFNRTLEVLEIPPEAPPEIPPDTNDWTWEIVSTWSVEDPNSIPLDQKLYYFDKNSNWKIDTLELEYDKALTGSLDLSKIKIYSNTGWLATFKINTLTWIVSGFYLSWNILGLNLVEQDNLKLNLVIDNTTTSDLRLKSLSWIWITDLFWNEITSLSLTTSFWNYIEDNIFNMTSEVLANSWEIVPENNDNSWEIVVDNIILAEIPEIVVDFQSPSYILENWENSYKCDKTEDECKINFNLENSFSGSFSESDYRCETDFWFITGEESDCNPTTVIFGSGIFDVRFRIIDKTNSANFREKTIHISNVYELLEVPNPVITVQSGLSSSLTCSSSDCSVNFTGENSFSWNESSFTCLWDFGFNTGEENDCNPSYVHFLSGNYTILFRIIDKWNSANYKETSINISNLYQAGWTQVSSQISQISITSLKALITLQWTIWKTKKQSWNNVYCHTDECNINFTAKHSMGDKLVYLWDFWNWQNSDKENPTWLIYKKWDYKIVLKIKDNSWGTSEDYFNVFVVWDEKIDEIIEEKIEEKVILDLNISKIKISKINPNPYWSDDFEWIELENLSDFSIKLAGCQLDDNIWKWSSKAYKFKNESISQKKTKKFYKTDSNLSLNNDKDSVNFSCNGEVLDSISWDYNVPDGYIITKDKKLEIDEKIKVTEVIDGDTIAVLINWKREKIRLIGVDTPESVHPYKKVEFYALEASIFSKKMLIWKEVKLEFDSEMYDKYWRILAYIRLDGVMFNRTLISMWYARPYLRFNFKYLKDFEKAWLEAKKNKVWMWADKEYVKILDKEMKEDKLDLIDKMEVEKDKNLEEQLDEILKIEDKELFKKKMEKFLKKSLKISAKKSKNWEIIISGNILPNLDVYFEVYPHSGPLPTGEGEEKTSSWVSVTPPDLPLKMGGINNLLVFNWDINDLSILKYFTKSDGNWDFDLKLNNVNYEDFTLKTYVKYSDEIYLVDEANFNKDKLNLVKEEKNKTEKKLNLDDYKIIIQWKKSKDKIIGDSSIFCKTKKYCSVNFSLFGSKKDELNYVWNFWNWEEFIWFNPKSLHYFPGNYNLTLKILDKDYNELRQLSFAIKVEKLLPKKRGRKSTSKTKIKKEFSLNFFFNKEKPEQKLWDEKIALSWVSLSFLILFLVYFIIRKHEKVREKN
ncbi:MAG: thermonuclease precursor (tnase) (micrococcal nuclease) [uncultured bacterium (gcode 4)]|uniref:Thermonuclease (Tnase) (Micrococcal nuclease) n=1 Tax=uncultured bacterium (gcode 4) TaxID=1234023 RepID=K2BWB5_9BACT|nr:MAG: thermonuclease precursor (tnase) (micrococcal nuclease) [uncultured bacterium (gcode 4)]